MLLILVLRLDLSTLTTEEESLEAVTWDVVFVCWLLRKKKISITQSEKVVLQQYKHRFKTVIEHLNTISSWAKIL